MALPSEKKLPQEKLVPLVYVPFNPGMSMTGVSITWGPRIEQIPLVVGQTCAKPLLRLRHRVESSEIDQQQGEDTCEGGNVLFEPHDSTVF